MSDDSETGALRYALNARPDPLGREWLAEAHERYAPPVAAEAERSPGADFDRDVFVMARAARTSAMATLVAAALVPAEELVDPNVDPPNREA